MPSDEGVFCKYCLTFKAVPFVKGDINLNCTKFFALVFFTVISVFFTSCSKDGIELGETADSTPDKLPPVPVECSDPNALTFDDGDFSFAKVINDDRESAEGELSVVEVQGNKMLKFSDDMTVPLKGKVQKISINSAKILGTERLPDVRRIEFDLYADATAPDYVNQDGNSMQVPGTINFGGGTVVALTDSKGKGKWYDFAEHEGGEYDFEMSGAVHGVFKFLLAESGMCWSEDMDDANFLIMRWGSENESNLYIDNIVFYDADGNSIPVR